VNDAPIEASGSVPLAGRGIRKRLHPGTPALPAACRLAQDTGAVGYTVRHSTIITFHSSSA